MKNRPKAGFNKYYGCSDWKSQSDDELFASDYRAIIVIWASAISKFTGKMDEEEFREKFAATIEAKDKCAAKECKDEEEKGPQ